MTWLAPLLPAGRLPVAKVRRVCFEDGDRKREARKERTRIRARAWYAKNKEKVKQKKAEWLAANPGKGAEHSRNWNEKNRAWKRLKQREWARKRRAENIARGLTGKGTPRKLVNHSRFKKGWRDAARP